MQDDFEKRTRISEIDWSKVKAYYKATMIRAASLYWHRKRDNRNRKEIPEIQLQIRENLICDKVHCKPVRNA